MGRRFKINERAGATLTALVMLGMLLASPIFVVLGGQVTAAQAGVEVTFDRQLSGDRVGQHKVPPLTSVTMTITATVSSQVDNSTLADYFPSDWTVTDANGGIVSIYNENYSKIEWNVGTVSDSVSRSYVIKSPQRTLPPTKYYFHSELTYWGGSVVSGDWMVIVADPPDQETLRPNAAGTYQEWDLSDTSHWEATSDQTDPTYIYTNVVGERDIENLDDPTFGDSDTINWVQINFRAYGVGSAGPEKAYNTYRVDGTDYEDIQHTITRDSWNDYIGTQLTGPGGAGSWTKAQVTALEAGVKADAVGETELILISEIWVVVDYTPAAPPGKPALYLPADGTVTNDNTPYFEWENGTNAENHRLVVDTDPNFADRENAIDNTIIGDNSFTPTIELPPDNYYWKVAAINAQGENWSENTWTFEIIPVVPEWQLIETWTGTVSAPAEWNLIETWTGTVQAPAEWQLIETWTGTVEAPAAWRVIETWTGTVSAPVEWQVIETWTGIVQAPAQWYLIETWTGTVTAPAAWNLIETWTGIVEAPAAWQLVETWTGTVETVGVPDFTISVNPTSGSVQQGGRTTATVTVTSINNYSPIVSLEASGQFSGVIVSFSPSSGIPNFNSTMTINVGSNVPTGDHTIIITSTGVGNKVRTWTYVLTITAVAPPPPPPPPSAPPVAPIVPTPTQLPIFSYTVLSMAGGIAGFAAAYSLLAKPSRPYIMLKRLERAMVRPKGRRIGRPLARPPVRVRRRVSPVELAALRRFERIARKRMKLAREWKKLAGKGRRKSASRVPRSPCI